MVPSKLSPKRCCVTVSLLGFVSAVDAFLPYTPTSAYLYSNNNGAFVYLLDPPSSSVPSGQLRALSTTSQITANSLSASVISSELPFLEQNSPSVSYTSTIGSDGSILVYTGTCIEFDPQASLWNFTPDVGSNNGGGTWNQLALDTSAIGAGTSIGVAFLANAFSFLPDTAHSQADLYLFGGMCPFANTTTDTGASAASYSNQLTLLSPAADAGNYGASVSTSTGTQPIAEAGFSVTALQPTYSNTTDGSQTIQQDFLLIGGHTKDAFINMSQVALFSLPQGSWTFLPVNQPGNDKTDLLRRQDSTSEIEPRSGHTTVLSEDGSKVVVFGGWVGDVSTPAEPQLAVLDVGIGYGGSKGWSWAEDDADAPSIAPGSGIYGHAAVLLPGNVMMVYGGYSILPPGSSQNKRQADGSPSTSIFLYNITSDSWIDTYDPSVVPDGPLSKSSQGTSGHLPSKAGIGIGLAVGLIIVAIIVIAVYVYWRRLRSKRIAQEREIEGEKRARELGDLDDTLRNHRSRASSAGRLDRDDLPTDGIWDGRSVSGQTAYPWPSGGNDTIPGWKRTYGRDAERSGIDLEIPSPQRGLRKHNGNNPYVTARYDDNRRHKIPGSFPVIDEQEEDELIRATSHSQNRGHQRVDSKSRLLGPDKTEDPFRDPSPARTNAPTRVIPRKPVGSSPPLGTQGTQATKSAAEQRHREMKGWVKDWAAADAALSGRNSPEKSDRTRSDLSERSARSVFSFKSDKTSSSGHSHPPSSSRIALNLIPAALNPFSQVPDLKPASNGAGRALASPPRSAGNSNPDSDSFASAQSYLNKMQADSETCAGKGASDHQTSRIVQPDTMPTFTQQDFQPRNRPPPSRTRSKMGTWVLGSVRRAIPTMNLSNNRSSSMTSTTVRPTMDPTGGFVDYSDVPLSAGAIGWSTSSSPTKAAGLPSALTPETSLDPPRRTVSDGGSSLFWAGKKGAADWGVDAAHGGNGQESPTRAGDGVRQRKRSGSEADCKGRTVYEASSSGSITDGDLDWDPEAAIHERTVQVMFTVPREKLRVVNTDVDADSVDTASNYNDGTSKRNTHETFDDLHNSKQVDPLEKL